jgi:hypothetical protein
MKLSIKVKEMKGSGAQYLEENNLKVAYAKFSFLG